MVSIHCSLYYENTIVHIKYYSNHFIGYFSAYHVNHKKNCLITANSFIFQLFFTSIFLRALREKKILDAPLGQNIEQTIWPDDFNTDIERNKRYIIAFNGKNDRNDR